MPHREDGLFGILFLAVFLIPLAFVPILQEPYETFKYALLVGLSGAGLLILAYRKQARLHKALIGLLSGFVILNLASTLFSLDWVNSVIGLYGRYTGSIIFIISWVVLLVLMWTVLGGGTDPSTEKKNTLLRVLAFDAIVISVLGVLQYFDFAYYGGTTPGVRPIIPSFIGNQNFYAMFLIGVLPVLPILWTKAKTNLGKIYYAAAGFLSLWAIALSGSRGALVGLAATFGVMLFFTVLRKYSRVYIWFSLALIALFALFYVGFFANTRVDSLEGPSKVASYTQETRFALWNNTTQIIAKYPLLGTGPSNFFIAFGQMGDSVFAGNERFDDAHNLFLNIASMSGLPALAVFLVICAFVAWKAFKMTWQKDVYAWWALAALVGILVSTCFNPVCIPVWVLLALIFSAVTLPETFDYKWTQLATVKCVVLGVLGIVFAGSFIASDVLTSYGIYAYRAKDSLSAEKYLSPAVTLNWFNTSAQLYYIGSQINLEKDFDLQSKRIDRILSLHKYSAGTFRSAADLNYRLFIKTKDEKYKLRMNELYEQALQAEPNSISVLGAAGYAAFKTDQHDLAMSYLKKQLSFPANESYPYSWLLISKLYFDEGNKSAGLAAVQTANQILTEPLLIKRFIEAAQQADDPSKLLFPVQFPDLDI